MCKLRVVVATIVLVDSCQSLANDYGDDVTFVSVQANVENLTDLHLLGLNSFGGDEFPVGDAMLLMYRWALEDIGKIKDLLQGYRLVLHMGDSQVSGVHTDYTRG